MIKFTLVCDRAHTFEGWFRSNDDFDGQTQCGLVNCPHCGSTSVVKSLMAPNVATSRGREENEARILETAQSEVREKITELGRVIRAKGENVGDRFAEEAREIHYGESETRQIYGGASDQEVRDLVEEGVPIIPLPPLPDEAN